MRDCYDLFTCCLPILVMKSDIVASELQKQLDLEVINECGGEFIVMNFVTSYYQHIDHSMVWHYITTSPVMTHMMTSF